MKVGAATETEMKEKKHRVEDALQATRAALEEGIVPGGGVALLEASAAINLDAVEDEDEKTGARIVAARARGAAPPDRARTPASRARSSSTTSARARRATASTPRPASTSTSSSAGVIDPAMVTRSALQNAASIAKNILTTEAIVAEVPEKDGGGGGGMPDMGGMGGMM